MINKALHTRLKRIFKMAYVDFKGRYYNKKLGLLWAFLIPAIQIGLYYFIFHSVFQTKQENYVLYLYSAMMVWLVFIQSGNLGLELLREKKHLLETVQFNWLDLYLSNQLARTYSLGIQLIAYFGLLMILGVSWGSGWYLFPMIFTTWFLFSYSISVLLGLAYPVFEDIFHIWNLAGTVGLWSSGIFFDGTFFFKDYSWFAYLNPMVGIVLNTRAVLLEGNPVQWELAWVNLGTATLLTIVANLVFKKTAKKIVEHG